MTPVAIVALADIVLIVCVLAIVLSTEFSQRRELRRLRPEASRRPGRESPEAMARSVS